jgi:hypothetical protein
MKIRPYVHERGKKVTPLHLRPEDRRLLEEVASALDTTLIGAFRTMARTQCSLMGVACNVVVDRRKLKEKVAA